MSANNVGTPASPTAAMAAAIGRRKNTSLPARVLICQVARDSKSVRSGTSRLGKYTAVNGAPGAGSATLASITTVLVPSARRPSMIRPEDLVLRRARCDGGQRVE